MGLETFENEGAVWLKIKHGFLCEESKTERDGFRKIEGTLRDGTEYTKWIKPYRGVSGFVHKIEWYDREYNGRKFRGWNITLDADGTRCVLEIPFDSRINSRWMKLAEHIDFRKPVRFSAWHDRKDDTTAFNVQQDGTSVPQRYTKENPNGLPEPVKRMSGKWDYGAQEEFLYNRMVEVVLPTVDAAAALRLFKTAQSESEPEPPKAKAATVSSGLEPDDPFRDAPDPIQSGALDESDIPF